MAEETSTLVRIVFAVAATGRSLVQLGSHADRAPFAYTLSLVAAVIYLVATTCLLLGGRRATTHWGWLQQLPAVGAAPVAERVVRDGSIVTAAGVSAGIDMALTLLGEAADDRTAQTVQLAIEYDPQPPYDVTAPTKELADAALALIK